MQTPVGNLTISDLNGATGGNLSAPAADRGPAVAQRRFTFIGGAEGSGTTVLLRLLSTVPGGASLGGNFLKLPQHPAAKQLTAAFDAANRQLWDRKASFTTHAAGRTLWHEALRAILDSEAFADVSRLFFKRSFPFAMPRDQFAPDLWDVYDLWPDVQMLMIYRDPRAATYSAFRRGFDTDIRRLAVVCSEQLTWLAAQIRATGQMVPVISYRGMCNDPMAELAPIAELCGIPLALLETSVAAEGLKTTTDDRWAQELSPDEVRWLNEFFDERRLRQWDILATAR